MKKYKSLFLIILAGSFFHLLFLGANEILKNADSFAYLQMSYYFKNLSIQGFGTGWFGFLYSFFISIVDFITFGVNQYYSALYLNIILFGISAYLLYKIGEKYLEKKFNLLLIILFYLSPTLINFNITILSENIYIPLFLGLVLYLLKNYENGYKKVKDILVISFFIALLYFTRAEAFIYLGSIYLILFIREFFIKESQFMFRLDNTRVINLVKKIGLSLLFFILIIFPYVLNLHYITGDWGITNKGSSNLRQAQLRGNEKMDDEGFEKAVGELTSDNHHLKSGFVGGLKYDKGEKNGTIKSYLLVNPSETIIRIFKNQVKLYTRNLPDLIIGDSINLYYKSYLFVIFLIIPLLLALFGVYKLFVQKKYNILIVFFSFFLVGELFFTLFFVLDRYFLIFLPLILMFIVYGIQSMKREMVIKYSLFFLLISLYLFGSIMFYIEARQNDNRYLVKRVAGEWMKNNLNLNFENSKIMERFPIVTYYSGTRERWITPYTDKIDNLLEYARYNKIQYLVVDSLDFKTYRPKLKQLLENDFENTLLHKIKTIQVNGEKVILYKFSF